jgi:amino acid transporter
MRNLMDELANIVNFGALCGFLLLHVSVLVKFGFKGRSSRWFVHWAVPALGIVVVLAVLQGMSSLALTVGLLWLAAGLVYGLVLHHMRRDELHTQL